MPLNTAHLRLVTIHPYDDGNSNGTETPAPVKPTRCHWSACVHLAAVSVSVADGVVR